MRGFEDVQYLYYSLVHRGGVGRFPDAMQSDATLMCCAGRLKVMVDLLLLFGGYATVFLVSPKRNGAGGVAGGAPGSLARPALIGRGRPKVREEACLEDMEYIRFLSKRSD